MSVLLAEPIVQSKATPSAVGRGSKLDLFLLSGTSLLLMFAVLAFGAVEIWAITLLELGAAALLVCAVLGRLFSKDALQIRTSPLFIPALLFAAVVSAQLVFHLTSYGYVTLITALQYVAYGMVAFIAVQMSGEEKSSRVVMLMWGGFGAALALFAVCQHLTWNGKIYWVRALYMGGSPFGPYVNHNHYAGVAEMLTPFLAVLAVSGQVRGGQRVLAGFGAVLMAGSIVLSGSRGGAVALLAEIALLIYIVARLRQSNLKIVVAVLGLLMLVFVIWLGTPSLWRHFGDLQDDTRVAILGDSWKMFRQRPLWGWGLGTFPTVYPGFRSFYTNLLVNAAHNDYLQALLETGVAGFACVVWFVALLYRDGLTKIHLWHRTWGHSLRLAALVGCTGILVHSFLDFNLQIPANAAIFYFLCALVTSPNDRPDAEDRSLHLVP